MFGGLFKGKETSGKDWSTWKAPKKGEAKPVNLEKQVAAATNQAMIEGAEELFKQQITTRSSIGRKKELGYDPNEQGIDMADKGAVNVKSKSFQEMQNANIAQLKHKVDMSSAIDIGATGTDDEPFEIEHDSHRYKQTG